MFDVVSAVTHLSADLIVNDACPDLLEMVDISSDALAVDCKPIASFDDTLDRPVQLTVEVVNDSNFVVSGPAAAIYLDLC